MKKLGIIGGLGPMATAYFFQLIVEMTDAHTDQEHIEILIHNCPSIPDRTEYILGKSKASPLAPMIDIGRKLAVQGVDVLAIPCITAHYFHEELEKSIDKPIVHAVRETSKYIKERGIERVGIMASDATIYKCVFSSELERMGISSICPDEKKQEQVMHLIYNNVKSSNPVERELFEDVSQSLFKNGAQLILLACTELSMIKRDGKIGSGFLDVTELLAKCCVEQCGVLKEEYKELITE